MPELTEITESAAAAVPSTSADNTEAKLEDAPSDTESEDTIPELEDAGENLEGGGPRQIRSFFDDRKQFVWW